MFLLPGQTGETWEPFRRGESVWKYGSIALQGASAVILGVKRLKKRDRL